MKLVNLTLNEYLEQLKSNAPAPGGGSVSALAGAQGTALIMMVADLTLGKEKYADYQEKCEMIKSKGEALFRELTEAIDKDTEAYFLVADAFKLPKNTDEEKAERSRVIAEATLVATEVPFRTMELGLEGLLLCESMEGSFNPNAGSDFGVAVLNYITCIKGAWLNVRINLSGVKDEEKRRNFEEKGRAIVAKGELIAAELYDRLEGSL